MARSRNIKPGFFVNDRLAECEPLARLMFIGLWTIADREGRLDYRPKKIKVETLPYDDCDAEKLLGQLEKAGFIVVYESQGIKYIQILNFNKHQNPHQKEQASTIPAPDMHSTCRADSLNPLTDSLNPLTDSADEKKSAVKENLSKQAVELYNETAEKIGLSKCQKLTESRKTKIKARLIDCDGIDGWKIALQKLEQSAFLRGNTGWKANIDFLLQESSFVKLMEGAYDNSGTTKGSGNGKSTAEQRRHQQLQDMHDWATEGVDD